MGDEIAAAAEALRAEKSDPVESRPERARYWLDHGIYGALLGMVVVGLIWLLAHRQRACANRCVGRGCWRAGSRGGYLASGSNSRQRLVADSRRVILPGVLRGGWRPSSKTGAETSGRCANRDPWGRQTT